MDDIQAAEREMTARDKHDSIYNDCYEKLLAKNKKEWLKTYMSNANELQSCILDYVDDFNPFFEFAIYGYKKDGLNDESMSLFYKTVVWCAGKSAKLDTETEMRSLSREKQANIVSGAYRFTANEYD